MSSDRPSVRPSVHPLTVYIYFALRGFSSFTGLILIKLGTNIYRVSSNCWKDVQGHGSKFRVTRCDDHGNLISSKLCLSLSDQLRLLPSFKRKLKTYLFNIMNLPRFVDNMTKHFVWRSSVTPCIKLTILSVVCLQLYPSNVMLCRCLQVVRYSSSSAVQARWLPGSQELLAMSLSGRFRWKLLWNSR